MNHPCPCRESQAGALHVDRMRSERRGQGGLVGKADRRQRRLQSGSGYWISERYGHFCASYLLGTTMFDVMPSRKWRVLAFVLAFICVVTHHCVAGPLPKPKGKFIYCTSEQYGVPLPNPFPRVTSIPQPPTRAFWLDEINLTRITIPPEFRAYDAKAANTTRVILQTQPWPPPCPIWRAPL